jgi:hypothetical protein
MVRNLSRDCRSLHAPFDILAEGGQRAHRDLRGEFVVMKYMLLIYIDEQALTDPVRAHCYEESTELTHELSAAGQYLAANPLHPVATATSVRVRDGNPLITDGPFAETREQLGGYFLIDAKDLDEAIGIAARIPGARLGTVEIRPVMEIPGLPPARSPRPAC